MRTKGTACIDRSTRVSLSIVLQSKEPSHPGGLLLFSSLFCLCRAALLRGPPHELTQRQKIQKARQRHPRHRCADGRKRRCARDRPRHERRDDHGRIFKVQRKLTRVLLRLRAELMRQDDRQRLVARDKRGERRRHQRRAVGRGLLTQRGNAAAQPVEQPGPAKNAGIG
jgi:hypothetical protein